MILQKLRAAWPELQERFPVQRIGLFGSFAKGQQHHGSDVDLLVELREPMAWDFFDLQFYLEDLLEREVDVVEIKYLRPELSAEVHQEAIFL